MGRLSRACFRHNLRALIATPRVWAVAILIALYVENQFAPIRALLIDESRTVSAMGFLLYLFNDAQVTAFVGLCVLISLFDAPVVDATQRSIILRAGRGAWGRGQVQYILSIAAGCMAFFCLTAFAFSLPWADWSGDWGSGLIAFVREGAYEYYDSMLDFDPWLMDVFSPLSGFALIALLHLLAYSALALFMYAVNLRWTRKLGFLLAGAPLLLDAVMEEFFDVWVYFLSPVTLSRISALDYGDDMGRPPIWYALCVLVVLALVARAWAVRLSERREIAL